MKSLKLSDKTLKLIFLISIVGIILIFLSSMLSGKVGKADKSNEQSKKTAMKTETIESDIYQKKLEEQMTTLLKSMDGVGEVTVFITLQSGAENVYITEENLDLDTTANSQQRRSSQKKTLLVEDENGRKTALLKKTILPIVSGAVVVCEGGENPEICERITQALKAALCINSNHICVTKSAL